MCQATQLTRVNNALSFLAEANTARNQHLANFQGNVELWAASHQNRVAALENQLREARAEIQCIATRIPLPTTPPGPVGPTAWRSPIRQTSTSAPSAHSPPALGSPLRLNPETRPPAPEPMAGQGGDPPSTPPGSSAGPPSGPPSEPPRPPSGHPRSPLPPRNPAPTITTQDLVRLVAEGVERARQDRMARPEQGNIARLKMKNPETFDGKGSTSFNQWWEAVTMFLGFYPK